MQMNKLSSAAMAAAAAMLFTSAVPTVHSQGTPMPANALRGREFLQRDVRVQVRQEQLQGHEQLQGPGLGVDVEGATCEEAKAKAAAAK